MCVMTVYHDIYKYSRHYARFRYVILSFFSICGEIDHSRYNTVICHLLDDHYVLTTTTDSELYFLSVQFFCIYTQRRNRITNRLDKTTANISRQIYTRNREKFLSGSEY